METISLSLNKKQLELLHELYQNYEIQEKKNPYLVHFYSPIGCSISVYTTDKVVFQGPDADEYASLFVKPESFEVHAGSDEVGTGDYFGPVCVCATIVTKKDTGFLDKLGVRDSKAIDDEKIRQIAPEIMKKIPYSLLIVDNEKYNLVHRTSNANRIKALLHNQAYLNLARKTPLPKLKVIDQFCPEKTYYGYLKESEEVVKDIYFTTKAENKFPAVACGSIISRYAFLKRWEEMEEKYGMKLQKGSGAKVDECGRRFVEKYGVTELSQIAKMDFKNTERILGEKKKD